MKKLLLLLAFLFPSIVLAAPFVTGVGGTGSTSPSGILYGTNSSTNPLQTVIIGSGCIFSVGSLSCTGTNGSFSTTSANYWLQGVVSPSLTVSALISTSSTASTFVGSVGIGTTSPYSPLSVNGLTVFPNFFATSTTATSSINYRLTIGPTNGVKDKQLTISDILNPTSNAGSSGISVNFQGGGGIYMKDVGNNCELKYEAFGGVGGVGTMTACDLQFFAGNALGATMSNANRFFSIGTTTYNALLSVAGGNVLFGNAAAQMGTFKYNYSSTRGGAWFGIYDAGNSLYYGVCQTLPCPAGTTGIGGYFNGVGVSGTTNGGTAPIFGVLNSAQSGSGIGNTAFTIEDGNQIFDFFNVIDDGTGKMGLGTTTPAAKLSVEGTSLLGNSAYVGQLFATNTPQSITASGTTTTKVLNFSATSTAPLITITNALGIVTPYLKNPTDGSLILGTGAGIQSSGIGAVLIGDLAGRALTTGTNNTVIGFKAGSLMTNASSDVVIGVSAGNSLTSGNNNLLIGTNAGTGSGGGQALTSGALNIAITGVNASFGSGSQQQSIIIGSQGRVDCSRCAVIGSTDDIKFGIGTTSPYAIGTFVASSTAGNASTTLALVPSPSGRLLEIYSKQPSPVLTDTVSNGLLWGLGTTSPYLKLSVEGASALGNSALAGFFTATTTSATSTLQGSVLAPSGGNVGVGTTSPSQFLSINGSGYFSGNVGIGTNRPNFGAYAGQVLTIYSNSGAGVLEYIRNVTAGGSTLATFRAGSSDGVNSSNTLSGLDFLIDDLGGDRGAIVFNTFDNNAFSERGRMIYNGNFGLGTTSPYTKLAVSGESLASFFTATTSTATSTFMGDVWNRGYTKIASSSIYDHWEKQILWSPPVTSVAATANQWLCSAFQISVQKNVNGLEYWSGGAVAGNVVAGLYKGVTQDTMAGATRVASSTIQYPQTSVINSAQFLPMATTTIAAGQYYGCIQFSSASGSYDRGSNLGSSNALTNLGATFGDTTFGNFTLNAPAITGTISNIPGMILLLSE